MPSSFPGGLDSFSTTRADSTPQASTHATEHNNTNDALNKIEAELGVTPKGTDASVAARLARIDSAALAALGTSPQGSDATVAARLTRFEGVEFNVKNPAYSGGAKGDGVTDDKPAFQAAVDACNTAGGGIVLLPPGTYLFSTYPTIKSNVWVRGAGKFATTIKLKDASNVTVLYNGGTQSNIVVSDLTVDGNKANQSSGTSDGIGFSGGSNAMIMNVRVQNCRTRGISLASMDDSLIFGCDIVSNGVAGITAEGSITVDSASDRVRIINNKVETPQWHGIQSASPGGVITGNTVRNPVGSDAIGIATAGSNDATVSSNYVTSAGNGNCFDIGDSVNTTITGNVGVGGSTGLDQDSGSNVNRGNKNTISNNIFHGCSLYGIAIGGTNNTGNGYDVSIIGNIVSACAAGIGVDGITNGVVANNIVKNPTGANPGIKFLSNFKATTGFVVTGNRCYDDQGSPLQTYGIQSVGTCDYLTVFGNDVRGNVTGGINLVGSNNKVRSNNGHVTENGGTSTQTPGAVATVNIAHGLAAAPTNFQVLPGDVNARGAPSVYLTADATNVILNFSANLTAATSYTWRWRAEV